MTTKSGDFIIAVMARDRPGIIAAITRAVFELEGNVTELSQTVMGGYFTLILRATLPAGLTPETVRQRIETARPELELAACVRRYDPEPLFMPEDDTAWFLTLQGPDRPGLIAEVTEALARRQINIEDLYTRSGNEEITMIFQIRPRDPQGAEALRAELETLGARLGLTLHLLHQDILHATSEVGAIRRWVRP